MEDSSQEVKNLKVDISERQTYLKELSLFARKIAKGDFSGHVPWTDSEKFLAESLQQVQTQHQEACDVLSSLSKGDFTREYSLLDEKDLLGKSLNNCLQAARDKENLLENTQNNCTDLQDHNEGIILFSGLIIYVLFLFIKKEKVEAEVDFVPARARDYFFLVLSLCAVLAGGHLLVEGAVGIAEAFGISQWIIGVTIVAAGTSAPEFVTSLTAAIKGHHGISAGNLIGSDLFNLLCVLGLAGIIRPMTVTPQAHSSLIMLVGMVIIVVFLMRTGWKLSRTEGCFLVSANLLRWVLDYMAK